MFDSDGNSSFDDEKSSHYYLESKDKNTADQSICGALDIFDLLIISNKLM